MSCVKVGLHKKYIHQLLTPNPISGTLFGFEIGWGEPKLRNKVLGPKRGPLSEKLIDLYHLTNQAISPNTMAR